VTARDTILDHDQQARAAAVKLETAGRLPQGYVDQHYGLSRVEQREIRRLRACLEAAPDADIFLALERGDEVPLERLNQRVADAQRRRQS
jgi:hypothetical protein